MKTSEVGEYYVLFNDDFKQRVCFLDDVFIGIFNNTIKKYDKNLQMTEYDSVVYIHVLDDCAEFVKIYSYDNQLNNQPQKIYIDTPYEFGGNKYILKYECKDEFLEEIFNSFKSQTLEGYCNIKSLLINYAKNKGISGKQAVGQMVTKIDVPEVEGTSNL